MLRFERRVLSAHAAVKALAGASAIPVIMGGGHMRIYPDEVDITDVRR
jgi:hypothetical protein